MLKLRAWFAPGFQSHNRTLNIAPNAAAEVPRSDDESEKVEEEAGRGEDVKVEEHGQSVGQKALQIQ